MVNEGDKFQNFNSFMRFYSLTDRCLAKWMLTL